MVVNCTEICLLCRPFKHSKLGVTCKKPVGDDLSHMAWIIFLLEVEDMVRKGWTWSATELTKAVAVKRHWVATWGPRLCHENILRHYTPTSLNRLCMAGWILAFIATRQRTQCFSNLLFSKFYVPVQIVALVSCLLTRVALVCYIQQPCHVQSHHSGASLLFCLLLSRKFR